MADTSIDARRNQRDNQQGGQIDSDHLATQSLQVLSATIEFQAQVLRTCSDGLMQLSRSIAQASQQNQNQGWGGVGQSNQQQRYGT